MIKGDDSQQIAMYTPMARDFSEMRKLQIGTEWASPFDDVPVGRSEQELERWLWAHVTTTTTTVETPSRSSKEAPPQQQIATIKMANLRDMTHFPTWSNLPNEQDLFTNPYHGASPKKHYCFLGEITEHFTLIRLQIHLRDLSRTAVIPLFLRTPGRETEVPQGLCKKGNTVAVLYPFQHDLMAGDTGIRLEDEELIKVGCLLSHSSCLCKFVLLFLLTINSLDLPRYSPHP